MTHRFARPLFKILSAGCWLLLVITFYWTLVDDKSPVTFTDLYQPLGNLEDIIDPADPLIIQRRVCAVRDVDAVLSVKFIDGIVYSAPDRNVRIQKGCKLYQSYVDVPHTLNAGRYTYNSILRFNNNALSHPVVILQQVSFFLGPRKTLPAIDPPPARAEFAP